MKAKLTEKIIALGFSALLGLSTWTLKSVVDLKVQVAEIRTQVTALTINQNKIIVTNP